MLILEFLNRISFFSVLTWGFFLIAAVSAILVTAFRSPLLRRYRRTLIATSTSAFLLGILSGAFPFVLSRVSPDQSRLTPIDQLIPTEWIEPVSNPETSVSPEEAQWARALGYTFRYKLKFDHEFRQILLAGGSAMVVLDAKGNLHGFNAYTGLNHWVIPLRVQRLLRVIPDQRKLYLLERTSLDALRLSVVDFQSPALLWQRTLPRSKEGAIELDPESQLVYVSGGQNGIWALKTKTGEVLWKRPEIFSKIRTLSGSRHLLVFEPKSPNRGGAWHLLDPNTGKTRQKTPHGFADLRSLEGGDSRDSWALGASDPDQVFLMNPVSLAPLWTLRIDAPLLLDPLVDRDRYYVLNAQNLLEQRRLRDHELRWQKSLPPVRNPMLKVSSDGRLFGFPSEEEGQLRKVRFYKVEDGEYLASAEASEPILEWEFLGDWVYLMSENHLWAYKKD